MNNFSFHNPTQILFGKGTIPQIGEEIARRGEKKVLLLAGSGSIKQNGVYDQTVQSLEAAGIARVECWGVQANPVLSKVREAIDLCRAEGVDAVLAVGGGSVLDSAKAVACGFYLNDVWAAYEKTEAITKALPLYTILTLSATGSEMNMFSVLTKPEEHKKWAIGHPSLYPVLSIVDPAVQTSLPWRQTVCGGVDSLSHIMEFYFIGKPTDTTVAVNTAVSRTIIEAVDQLQREPGDYDSRASLAWGSTLALNGISGCGLNFGEWSTHQLEHAVSAHHPDVAHAEGLAVLFPAWIEYCEAANPDTFAHWAQAVWDSNGVADGIDAFRDRLRQWEAPVSLADLGVKREEIPAIADTAMLTQPLGSLRPLSREDVVNILEIAANAS
ncbi:MAG: iron-containing alcohol dehydrogenase [Bryobacterales bacterium]|nr:iron-containing alcohol dehydrogenase [Bryobacterales bacterium]